MTLSIYRDHKAPEKRPPLSNAGLWYERFFNQFDEEGEGDQKAKWLKDNFKGKAGVKEQLEAHAMKQLKLAESLGGTAKVFITSANFIPGMGNPHPVENGLSWHPTLGVPYLNGASVKGMVRNWIEVWEKEADTTDQREKVLRWFGSTDKDPAAKDYNVGTGDLVFFDAVPIEPVSLNVDIMTPHMGKWYEKGGEITSIKDEPEKIPADWHDPTPVPYLVVQEARFLFTMAPRTKNCAIDLDTVMHALQKSLNYTGAGAKTAVGYGQMLPDEKGFARLEEASAKRQHEDKVSRMSPEKREIEALGQMIEQDKATGNKTPGSATNQKLLDLIRDAKTWSQPEREQLADLGEEFYNFAGWGNKKKKKTRKALLAGLCAGA